MNSVYWNQAPRVLKWGSTSGENLGKMAKKLYENYKINTFMPKQWRHMQGASHFFCVVRGITLLPRKNPGNKFQLKWQFNILDQICFKKKHFQSRTVKEEHHHLILHIQISLGTKFLPKLTILTFLTKFAQKRYVQSKGKKVNSNNEFFIFWTQGISE